MTAHEPQRRRGRQSAETAIKTRQTIIEAATESFSRLGYEATSVREIAQSAQLTHGTLRHHFGSKLEIWKAVADTVLDYYRAQLMPIVIAAEQEADPLHGFKQVVRAFINASYNNPVFAKLLMVETQTDNERSTHLERNFLSLHNPIGKLFERARTQCGSLQNYSNDSFFLALISLTFFPLMLPGIQSLLGDTATASPEQHVERIMGILFNDTHR